VSVEILNGKFYNQSMSIKRILAIFMVFSLLSGCGKLPYSKRYPDAQPTAEEIPLQQEVVLGEEAFREIIQKETLSLDGQLITIVERVGRQLAAVSPVPNLKWEFHLIESGKKNAIALPGGKVAIYTGILPVCANEAGLAALMSHQIAHDIARHRSERLAAVMETGIRTTPIGLSNSKNKDMLLSALGIETLENWVGPFNPNHEFEADDFGLMLMAKAGYDPGEAERFWNRVDKMQQGARPPELIHFHPVDTRRLQDIRRLLPKANRAYRTNPLKHGLGQSFLYILSRRKIQEMNNKSSEPAKSPLPESFPPANSH